MKTQQAKRGFTLFKTALSLALALLATLSPARATLLYSGVDLGDAGRTTEWALFALTGGITIADTTARTFDPNVYPAGPYSGSPTVRGDVGVSANSITISGTTKVEGTAYIKTGGLLRKSGIASVHGNGGLAIQSSANDTFMNKVKSDAIAAAGQAYALSPTLAGAMFAGSGGTFGPSLISSSGGPGSLTDSTGGAHVVLTLSDFILSSGATFTLSGTALTTYVINIANKFSLVGGSVLLAGGLQSSNVLFNVVGAGLDIALSAAAQFNGVILAPSRTFNLSSGAQVGSFPPDSLVGGGTIIAGKVNISGGATVSHLPAVSP